MASPPELQRDREDSPDTKEMLHKTKLIQFLGRNTPIILQNDNGPCPLFSICNVLSLRNNLNLSADVAEVSQEKLLSLVAERLIDSNSNFNNKDAGYAENQQQNISDAIDLLPRFTTGIDVNLKFTRIDDFEFTRECAIFDLLDIPLYHGWIVDPKDFDTSNAIGLKSYNTLMGELVALETQNSASDLKNTEEEEEDCVDFVAATTASLGVPSPSLSRNISFDDPHNSVSDNKKERKGDIEEEKELLKALKLSETENVVNTVESNPCGNLKESENGEFNLLKKENDSITFETVSTQDVCSSSLADKIDEIEKNSTDVLVQSETDLFPPVNALVGNEKLQDESKGNDVNLQSSNEIPQPIDESEPIYEGEEHIQETSTANYENQEPVYEGEVVLAEQGDKVSSSADETKGKSGMTPKQGELIRNFLKNSASQLTIYGLFSLLERIKERELCVFFRNNHFNTMFKLEGELYILATDQGYINQPDLVWEKLNEVNGDTVYMTGSFKEFNPENPPESRSWDEQNALANTSEYLASIEQENPEFNSDLQLALALQQQEFEEQQPPQQLNLPQPNTSGQSGLVTGPQHVQPSRPKNSSNKESKSSCTVM